MKKKERKAEKRKKLLGEREEKEKRRAVKVRDDEKTTVYRHPTAKGYNVQMIQDFLDHLLLEIRAQHFENLKALKKLEATEDMKAAQEAAGETSEKLVEQFRKYQERYETVLIAANSIDGANASPEEVREFTKTLLRKNIERRDEQIRHLESLQGLFEEALSCAKMPFGMGKDGQWIQAIREYKVREVVDELRRRDAERNT